MKSFHSAFWVVLLMVVLPTLLVAQAVAIDLDDARKLLSDAHVLYEDGKFQQAEEQAEGAYNFFKSNAGAESKELAEAAYQTGLAAFQLGKYNGVKPFFKEAAEIWSALYPQGSQHTADAWHQLGLCYYNRGEADQALVFCTKAYLIRQNVLPPNHRDLAESLRVLGNIYLDYGQYPKALQNYQDALKIEKICSGEESLRVADVLGNLGYAWNLIGNYQKSLEEHEKALLIRQKKLPPDDLDIALSCHTLGMLYKSLLKYDEALQYFEQALKIRRQKLGEVHEDVANTCSEMGRTYLAKQDYQKALTYFEKENDIQVQTNKANGRDYTYTCTDLGLVNLRLKNYAEAIKWQEKAVSIWRAAFQNVNSPLASSLLQLGYTRLANGDFQLALYRFQEAKQIWETIWGIDSPNAAQADAGIATVYWQWYLASGQAELLEKSREYFRLAKDGIEKMQQTEVSAEGQKKILAEAKPIFEKAISTEMRFMEKDPRNPEYLEKAWQFSESMHAYMLYAATHEANARHFAGIPDDQLNRDSLLQVKITSLGKKRQRLIQNQGLALTDSLVVAVSTQLSAKKQEATDLRAFFEKNYPDYFRLKYAVQTSTLAETQRMLGPEQTLLEYFTGDSSMFVFVLQHNGSRIVELKNDFPLAEWTQTLREGISGYYTNPQKNSALYAKTVRQYAEAAQKLYGKLLAPLADLLTPELIVVPSESLANIPFEALLSAPPKDPSNFGTYPFVLRQNSIQYAYSASMLKQMTERQALRAPKEGLLAFAPFFEGDTTGVAMRVDAGKGTRLGLSPLPYTGEEVSRVKKYFGESATVLLGKSATKQKFMELAAQYKVLHLATHGKANHQAGDYSFLAFSTKIDNVENGLLAVAELYNLPINADLVLLSACETGIGEEQRGEGVVSLARAFAFAGAKSILASLWSVNDKSTMQVMDSFYAGLKAGKSKNLALAQAKRQYLEQNPGLPSHPFYWAGFVGVGDMTPIKW